MAARAPAQGSQGDNVRVVVRQRRAVHAAAPASRRLTLAARCRPASAKEEGQAQVVKCGPKTVRAAACGRTLAAPRLAARPDPRLTAPPARRR